jgi:transcriptional regulator with XRE-family HTH domain
MAAPTMYSGSVKLSEKLKEFTKKRSQASIARDAGLAPSILSNYINRGSEPLASAALKLARALEVPVDWLLDDAQGFPAPEPTPKPSASDLPDRELMMELAVRQRRLLLDFLQTLESANAIDWNKAASDAANLSPSDPLPDSAKQGIANLAALDVKFSRTSQDYDLPFYVVLNHETLPGGNVPLQMLDWLHFDTKYGQFSERPEVRRFIETVRPHLEWQQRPERKSLADYELAMRTYCRKLGLGQVAPLPQLVVPTQVAVPPVHPPAPAAAPPPAPTPTAKRRRKKGQ